MLTSTTLTKCCTATNAAVNNNDNGKLYKHNEDNSVISGVHQHLKKETTTNGFVSEKLNYIMKSLMQV